MDAGDDPYRSRPGARRRRGGAAPAYRRLALRLHPDKDPSAAAASRGSRAWAALESPEARALTTRRARARAVVWMDVPLRAFAAGGAGARSYPCRCGGAFEIFDDEPCADGDLVPCDGCSAHVRLVA